MIYKNTKIAILLTLPFMSACQWHGNSWSEKRYIFGETHEQTHQAKPFEQHLPSGPVTLGEAIARGLIFNADYRAKAIERQNEAKKLARKPFSLFPKVYANANVTYRVNEEASVAARVTPTNLPRTTEHYTATDNIRGMGAIEATWNLLDLGLSAYNRKIAENVQRGQDLIWRHDAKKLSTDIVRAFWRLNAHQNHHDKFKSLSRQVEKAIAEARQEIIKTGNKEANLFFMREVTDLYRYLLALERSIANAPAMMNSLLNLPQSTKLTLSAHSKALPFETLSSEGWVEKALIYSPELKNARSKLALKDIETRRDIVTLLPSLTAVLGLQLDSNSFLLNGDWLKIGVRGSWNLLRLLEVPKIKRTAKARAKHQRQLLRKAAGLVARQSVIAQTQFHDASVEMRHAKRAVRIQQNIVFEFSKQVKSKIKPTRFLVKERIFLALASIRHDLAQAELETAKARMAELHGLGPRFRTNFTNAHTLQNYEFLLEEAKAFYEEPNHD